MKTFTRVIAVVMMVAVLATLMAACGKKTVIDQNVVGTWKQTDEVDGNWTWTLNSDGTCKLEGESGFSSEGTFYMENTDNGKIYVKLNDWNEEQLFTYAVTTKVLDLESIDLSYHCYKQ